MGDNHKRSDGRSVCGDAGGQRGMSRVARDGVLGAGSREVGLDNDLLRQGVGVLVYPRFVHVEDERGGDVMEEVLGGVHPALDFFVIRGEAGCLHRGCGDEADSLAPLQRLSEPSLVTRFPLSRKIFLTMSSSVMGSDARAALLTILEIHRKSSSESVERLPMNFASGLPAFRIDRIL